MFKTTYHVVPLIWKQCGTTWNGLMPLFNVTIVCKCFIGEVNISHYLLSTTIFWKVHRVEGYTCLICLCWFSSCLPFEHKIVLSLIVVSVFCFINRLCFAIRHKAGRINYFNMIFWPFSCMVFRSFFSLSVENADAAKVIYDYHVHMIWTVVLITDSYLKVRKSLHQT